jgi:leader peptidase (prepilin peptidase)/N-methyltransferase
MMEIIIFAFGLVIGFCNVVIYDFHREIIVTPGSQCRSCGSPIRPWDNIPLLSYFLLRGCRFCKEPISTRYPQLNASGMLFVRFYLKFESV